MKQELIWELMKQAGELAYEEHKAKCLEEGLDPERTVWSVTGATYEKFAELIVRECMNQVREQYLPVLEDELMMKDTHWDGYVQCGVDSYVGIREHFGVE